MPVIASAPYVNGWGKLQVELALEIFFAPLPFTGFAPLVPVLRRSTQRPGRRRPGRWRQRRVVLCP